MRGDDTLIITTLALTLFGLVMVYSASTFVAIKYYQIDWFIFTKQLRMALVGLGALLVGMTTDIRVWRGIVIPCLAICGIVMILQLVTPMGPIVKGTRRWVSLGFFVVQSSDIARCLLIVFLARVFSDDPNVLMRISKKFWLVMGIPFVFIVLTYLQPDLSGALMMMAVSGLMLFLGGIRILFLLGGVLASLPVLAVMIVRSGYQKDRILGYLFPATFDGGDQYQVTQSLIGFVRGGLFGVGLGESRQKMLFLPEPHTDFIYSIISEELGLAGAALLLIAFVALFLQAVRICVCQPDRYGFLLGAGLIGSVILYALVNMGVAVGILPVTGLPLPFISSGGTSLVISLWSVGVLWNLSRDAEG